MKFPNLPAPAPAGTKIKKFIFPFLPLLSAAFLAASYPPAENKWLVFVSLVPLLFFLHSGKNGKTAFGGSFLAGFLFVGWSVKWFFDSLPLEWLGLENGNFGFSLVFFIWFLTAASLAVFIGVFGLITAKLSLSFRPFSVAFLWIIMEYARAWFFSFIIYGNGGSLGPYWTFGSLGYNFGNFPALLQSAKIFGLYGASFFFVLINSLLAAMLAKRALLKEAALIFAISVLIYGSGTLKLKETGYSSGEREKNVVLIQTDFPRRSAQNPKQFLEFSEEELKMLERAAPIKPDLVILPEGSSLSLRFGSLTGLKLETIFRKEKPVRIADSARTVPDLTSPQRIFVYETGKGIVGAADKTFLIPGGEYLPYFIEFPAKIFGGKKWIDEFRKKRGLLKGDNGNFKLLGLKPEPEGILLCSAIIAPPFWRELSSQNAEILVNSASQAILYNSSHFYGQAEAMLRFFAAANDRWFLQAANGGYSYIIDNNGVIRAKTSGLGNKILAGKAEYRKTKPPYVRFGDWPVAAAAIFLFLRKFPHKRY